MCRSSTYLATGSIINPSNLHESDGFHFRRESYRATIGIREWSSAAAGSNVYGIILCLPITRARGTGICGIASGKSLDHSHSGGSFYNSFRYYNRSSCLLAVISVGAINGSYLIAFGIIVQNSVLVPIDKNRKTTGEASIGISLKSNGV